MIERNKNFSPVHWTTLFLWIAILLIGFVFMINYTVDPFGNRNWIVEKYYKPIVHERSEKYSYIFKQTNIEKYDCLILGSSRVMTITPSLNEATKGCYNFGVHVANNPEKLFILQEWLKRAPLKTVYLGNELYNIHALTRPLYLNPHAFIGGSENNYLSISTLLISFKTLKNCLKKESQTYFREDGSINYIQEETAIKAGTFDHSSQHFKQIAHEAVEENFIHNQFSYESKAIEPLRQIKNLCDQHHVKIYPFITPTFYGTQTEMASHPDLVSTSQKFRSDLVNIFGEVYDFDTLSSENQNPKNFYDAVHYRPLIGNLIIKSIEQNHQYGNLLIKH